MHNVSYLKEALRSKVTVGSEEFRIIFMHISLRLARLLSSGFGSGYAKIAPGTFGTGAVLLPWWLFGYAVHLGTAADPSSTPDCQALLDLLLPVVVIAAGYWAVSRVLAEPAEAKDPQWIVVDEWAGVLIALIGVGHNDLGLAIVAFLSFRFFDISKIGPIGWAERLPGARGVMADDLVAGVFSWCVVRGVAYLW